MKSPTQRLPPPPGHRPVSSSPAHRWGGRLPPSAPPPLYRCHFRPPRQRCQHDPAGAGLAAYQGEGGGRLPRRRAGVPLRSGAGGRPVASTGRGGREGPGLAWPGGEIRCVWAEWRARPCLCLPQFTRYSALLVGMIYGKKRYGECGAPGGLSPSPARPARAPWGGGCGPRSRGPGRHFPPPRRSGSCLGLAEVALKGRDLTGLKSQVRMKCAFVPAKLFFLPFRVS